MKKKIDWESIKKEYLAKKITKTDLAKKYGVSLSAIRYNSQKNGWDNISKKSRKSSVSKRVVKKSIEQMEIDYNEEHLKMYEDCARIIRAITKLYLDSDLEPDAGALQKIVASIEKIQKGQRVSLGLDKDTADNNLPTINIVENLDREKL